MGFKYEGEWHVAYFRKGIKDNPDAWTLTAYIDDSWWHYDSDFEEIDERRIEREPSVEEKNAEYDIKPPTPEQRERDLERFKEALKFYYPDLHKRK